MSMTNPLEIVPGSRVTLHFSLALEDGTEAVSTFGEDPLEFTMGDGTLRPGMELALYGLKSGDRQTLTLEPEQAYGYHDEEKIHDIDREQFPNGISLEAGQIIGFTMPNGDETAGMIIELDENEVVVDFNHPLAGKEVVFEVEVLEVAPATTQ